jgi:hypothetical protein
MTRRHLLIILAVILLVGLLLRLFRIDFGLPLTFFPDETDLSDAAINYSIGAKAALENGNINFFKPNSFVYGTFPSYFLTINLIFFKVVVSLFKINTDYFSYFLEMRVVTAILSMLIPMLTGLIYFKLFKDKKGLVASLFLSALNWKLIYHSHYLNQDIYLTILLCLSFTFLLLYLKTDNIKGATLLVMLSGSSFGLATGTKITSLLSFPLIFLLFFSFKKRKEVVFFALSALITYIISNPFSILSLKDFVSRIIEMVSKEGGIVFSSVDTGPFKYLFGLSYMLTLPVLTLAIYGIVRKILSASPFKLYEREKIFHVFLILNILVYFIFFSIEPRRSDRFLLPVIPILILYASYGLSYLYSRLRINRCLVITLVGIFAVYYAYFPLSLTMQLSKNKPRLDAYYWVKQQPLSDKKILVYTEDGQDPFSRIKGSTVLVYSVYVSKGAQFSLPQDPLIYDYVVLASKPMENYKRPYVIKNYPDYFNNWRAFESTVTASDKFSLVKDFKTSNLNLLYFSEISVYRRN